MTLPGGHFGALLAVEAEEGQSQASQAITWHCRLVGIPDGGAARLPRPGVPGGLSKTGIGARGCRRGERPGEREGEGVVQMKRQPAKPV